MKGAFVQVKSFVEHNFPGTEVLGTQYPVPIVKVLLGRGVFFIQLGLAAVMLAGEQIFQALNMPPPQLYLQYREKKLGVIMGAWFIGNMIQNSLTSTGAFEVYSCGEQIFSKLQTNRMPSVEELLDGLKRTLQPDV